MDWDEWKRSCYRDLASFSENGDYSEEEKDGARLALDNASKATFISEDSAAEEIQSILNDSLNPIAAMRGRRALDYLMDLLEERDMEMIELLAGEDL